jgi:hypothetical protein
MRAISNYGSLAASVGAALALEAAKGRLRARLASAKDVFETERLKLRGLRDDRRAINQQLQRTLSQFDSSNCEIHAARP